MGTTKVSNRSESPGRHGGNYKIDTTVVRTAIRKKKTPLKSKGNNTFAQENTEIEIPRFQIKELAIHKSRKKSSEEKLVSRKQIDSDIELAKNDIKKALEKIGNIKYYTEL